MRVNGVALTASDAARVGASQASRGASEAGALGRSSARVLAVARSGDLWRAMTPGAIVRDTWADLRSGVDLVRAPGLYRPGAGGHVSRPVDTVANPVEEYRADVAKTWAENRMAGVFSALGNDVAARAMAPAPDVSARYGWAALSGGVQVVETVCAVSALASPRSAVIDGACTASVPAMNVER